MGFRIVYIFCLLLSVISYGQVNIALQTDKKEYGLNELIEVSVVVEINGTDFVRESPIQLPDFSKFYDRASGSTSNVVMDPETNTAVAQMIYQVVLQAKEAGTIKIGSALVRVSGKTYKTEPFDIIVVDRGIAMAPTPKVQNDLFVNMEVKDREVFANEPTVAILRAYSKDFNNLRKVGEVIFTNQHNIDVHPVSLVKSEIELNSRSHMHSQVIAVYLLYPKEPGRIEVQPAIVKLKDPTSKDKIKTNKIPLNVKKLPLDRPEGFHNAVGNFHVEVSNNLTDTKAELHKPIDVFVKIKGEGNLTENILPQIIETPDYKVFPPKIEKKVKAGEDGLHGSIEAHYVIIPQKPGQINIKTAGFAYFNPANEQFVNLGQKNFALHILTETQIQEAKSTIDKVSDFGTNVLENVPILSTVTNTSTKAKSQWSFKNLFLEYYPSIGFVLGILTVSLLFFKKLKTKESPIVNVQPIENVSEVEDRIRSHQKIDIDSTISDLDSLLASEDYDGYIEQSLILFQDIENQYVDKEGVRFFDYVSQEFGVQTAENLRNIKQTITIEKYAPVHLKHTFEELHNEFRVILNKIA